jgi:hypothetical protein
LPFLIPRSCLHSLALGTCPSSKPEIAIWAFGRSHQSDTLFSFPPPQCILWLHCAHEENSSLSRYHKFSYLATSIPFATLFHLFLEKSHIFRLTNLECSHLWEAIILPTIVEAFHFSL